LKLIQTGLWSSSAYGHVATGAAPYGAASHRSDMSAALGVNGYPCAPVAALALHLGEDADPAVRFIVEQVRCWIAFWISNPAMRFEVTRAWLHLRLEFLQNGADWKKVVGPVAATIASLHTAGWKPVEPMAWNDLLGHTHEIWIQVNETVLFQYSRANSITDMLRDSMLDKL